MAKDKKWQLLLDLLVLACATQRGTMKVTSDLGVQGLLEDVLLCPDATYNLLSVPKMQQAGYTIIFDPHGSRICKGDATIMRVCIPLLTLTLVAQPFQRGFFIDDSSIRLPYKQQTVTEVTLALVGFALNIATIIIIEYLQNRREKNPNKTYLFGFSVPAWVWQSYTTIRTFTFGAACQQLLSNVTKYVIGRLRPHFMDVCRPVYNESLAANSLGYIQDYTCGNMLGESILKDMRLSFYSAHSSFAMYAAVFFIIYIQFKGKWRGSKLLRHAVQFLVIMAAWYVGLTRAVENFHHWSDVAVGFINGAIFGVLVVIFVLKPSKRLPMTWQDAGPGSALPVAR